MPANANFFKLSHYLLLKSYDRFQTILAKIQIVYPGMMRGRTDACES